jgi:secreted trypsin-like serine protease
LRKHSIIRLQIYYLHLLLTVETDWKSLREVDDNETDHIVGGTAAAAGEIPYQV